jgi:iron complex transport system substrate-binding protein
MRIASLIPSATEMVHALGLGGSLVAVSHDCDFPPSVARLPVVTRSFVPANASSGEIDRAVRELRGSSRALYALDVEALEQLRPDLILTQALCTVCAVSEEEVHVAARRLPGHPEVVNLEARSLQEVLDGIGLVAKRAGVTERGEALVRELSERVERVEARGAGRAPIPIAFIEWLDPPFASGHWNPELIRLAGASDPLGREGEPARVVEWSQVAAARPEMIFVAARGFGVERTLRDIPALARMPLWREVPAVRDGRIYVTDGAAYFSRPGPRLVDSLEILAHAVDPERHPLDARVPPAVRVDLVDLLGGMTAEGAPVPDEGRVSP